MHLLLHILFRFPTIPPAHPYPKIFPLLYTFIICVFDALPHIPPKSSFSLLTSDILYNCSIILLPAWPAIPPVIIPFIIPLIPMFFTVALEIFPNNLLLLSLYLLYLYILLDIEHIYYERP